jgi:ribose 5-phosphate isomerase B
VKIAVGADHAGFQLKDAIVRRLRAAGHEVVDHGTLDETAAVDYPRFAHAVARAVQRHEAERGVLVCGTGLGMCIVANRYRGVRAADCFSPHLAEMSRRHNDANVLCLAGRLLTADEAWAITDVWLDTPFEGGRHERRTALIEDGPGIDTAASHDTAVR